MYGVTPFKLIYALLINLRPCLGSFNDPNTRMIVQRHSVSKPAWLSSTAGLVVNNGYSSTPSMSSPESGIPACRAS